MVCVGKFDGNHHCIAAAAPNGNVLLHDPRSASNAVKTLAFGRRSPPHLNSQPQTPNIPCSIRGLSSVPGAALFARKQQQSNQRGSASEPQDNGDRDMLLLGGDTTAHVFDVHTNSDVFFKDVPDGACCCALGSISTDSAAAEATVVVGSNCSIQGFAHDGSESFWTVSGDSVTCIAFAYLDATLMLVGSKDSFIRVYSGEQLLHEISETAAPTCIKVVAPTGRAQFDACKWMCEWRQPLYV
jgi:Bardet-Biedl syndrome 2 protein